MNTMNEIEILAVAGGVTGDGNNGGCTGPRITIVNGKVVIETGLDAPQQP